MFLLLMIVCFLSVINNSEGQVAGSCQDIYVADPSSPSGTYTIHNDKSGQDFDVYCDFYDDGYGYTFFSKDTTADINIEDLYTDCDHVIVRQLRPDGGQQAVYLEQTLALQSYPLSIQFSAHEDHFIPLYRRKPYLFVGFLPLNVAKVNNYSTQGYRTNATDYTFRTCNIEETTNYLALYFNSDGSNLVNWRDQSHCYGSLPIDKHWIEAAVDLPVERKMPAQYYFPFEFLFGGCGAWVSSQACGAPLTGISVGIRFNAHASKAQMCQSTVKPSPPPPGTTVSAGITSFGSCKQIYEADPSSATGTYIIQTSSGYQLRVFCDFYDGYGYSYISRHTQTYSLNIGDLFTDSNHVILRQLEVNGTQRSVKLQQLTTFGYFPLSIQYNQHDAFPNIAYRRSPYIFVGFLPQDVAANSYPRARGYRANDVDFTYIPCSSRSDDFKSHIALYLIPDGSNIDDWRDSYCYGRYPLDTPWIEHATIVPESKNMPLEFFSPFELALGACGAWVSSNICGDCPVTGAAVGLRFDSSVAKPRTTSRASTRRTKPTTTTVTKPTKPTGPPVIEPSGAGHAKFIVLVATCAGVCALVVAVFVAATIIICRRNRRHANCGRTSRQPHATSSVLYVKDRNSRRERQMNQFQHSGTEKSGLPPQVYEPPPMYTPDDRSGQPPPLYVPEDQYVPEYYPRY